MNTLRNNTVRLAPWVAYSVPTPEQRATIEDKLDGARSWIRHGTRLMDPFRKETADKRLSSLLRRQAD